MTHMLGLVCKEKESPKVRCTMYNVHDHLGALGLRRYDMNGIFQMQGGKNWILPKYVDQCKPVLLGLSLAGNLVKQLLSLYGTEWSERGYGLCEERNISVWNAEWIEY